jgi:hypothetical protein
MKAAGLLMLLLFCCKARLADCANHSRPLTIRQRFLKKAFHTVMLGPYHVLFPFSGGKNINGKFEMLVFLHEVQDLEAINYVELDIHEQEVGHRTGLGEVSSFALQVVQKLAAVVNRGEYMIYAAVPGGLFDDVVVLEAAISHQDNPAFCMIFAHPGKLE